MPHCIIEHSNTLTDVITSEEIMDTALRAMLASELFELDDIKIRTKNYEYFKVGRIRADFIHMTIKILSGRSLAQKKNLATLVLTAMDDLSLSNVEITIDIQGMDAEAYLKLKK